MDARRGIGIVTQHRTNRESRIATYWVPVLPVVLGTQKNYNQRKMLLPVVLVPSTIVLGVPGIPPKWRGKV